MAVTWLWTVWWWRRRHHIPSPRFTAPLALHFSIPIPIPVENAFLFLPFTLLQINVSAFYSVVTQYYFTLITTALLHYDCDPHSQKDPPFSFSFSFSFSFTFFFKFNNKYAKILILIKYTRGIGQVKSPLSLPSIFFSTT